MDLGSSAKRVILIFSKKIKLSLDGSECIYSTIYGVKSFEDDSWQNPWFIAKLQVWDLAYLYFNSSIPIAHIYLALTHCRMVYWAHYTHDR